MQIPFKLSRTARLAVSAGSILVAWAGGAGAQAPTALDTVTVTGRTPESQRRVGPRVTGGTLRAFGADTLAGMRLWLPGLNLASVDPRQTNLAVRGLGNNPVSESVHGSVPVYLDGVYLGREGMATAALQDLDSVTLLRGPQGVLYGEYASGGALDIRTRAPTFTPQVRVSVGAGNRGILRSSGAVSGPLGGGLAGRVSAWHAHDDGWLKNRYDGGRLDGIDRNGVRGQLLFARGERWRARLIADYTEESDSQGALVVTGVGPAPSGYRNLRQTLAYVHAQPLPENARDYVVSNDIPQAVAVRQGGVTLKADVNLGGATLSSIGAWRSWQYAPQEDFDHSAADIYRDLGTTVHHRQWSQELRLTSSGRRRVDYLLGAGYYHENVTSAFDMGFGEDADAALLPSPFNSLPLIPVLRGINSQRTGTGHTDSGALFGRAAWHATRHIDLVAGGRVSYDRIRGRSARAPYTHAQPALLPIVGQVRQTLLGAADSGALQRHDLSAAGVLEADLHWNQGTLAYLRLSTNQKPGGINLGGAGITEIPGVDPLRFAPEHTRGVELGIERHPAGGRFHARLDVFLERVDGYQATEVLLSKQSFGNAPVGVLTNAGDVGSSGVEWALSGSPVAGLSLGVNGAYTDARYRDFDSAPCAAEHNPDAPPVCDLGGRHVDNSPLWMVNGWGRYQWQWSPRLGQALEVGYAWRSGVNGSLDDSRYNRLPAYGLLQAATALRWRWGMQYLTLRLWGYNLGNAHYFTGGGALSVGYAYAAAVGPPRSFGLSVVYGLD